MSELGLGYSLLQEGQPVVYGARGLTSTELNYAQIEKEMLAIIAGAKGLTSISMAVESLWRQIINH